MEIYHQTTDIQIMYVTADSFPEGIEPAFANLKKLVPKTGSRTLLGVSKPERNVVVYKAGVEQNAAGEAANYGLETFILEKGDYLVETVNNWEVNIPEISNTFQKLLHDERLDPAAYCVEWYKGADVMCMVKIKL